VTLYGAVPAPSTVQSGPDQPLRHVRHVPRGAGRQGAREIIPLHINRNLFSTNILVILILGLSQNKYAKQSVSRKKSVASTLRVGPVFDGLRWGWGLNSLMI